MKNLLKILLFSIVVQAISYNATCQIIAKNTNANLTNSLLKNEKSEDYSYANSSAILANKSSLTDKPNKEKLKIALEYDKLAETAFKKGLINDAEKYNMALLPIALSIRDTVLIINTKNREGLIYLERGKNKEAENKLMEALAMSKKFPTRTAEVNSNLGSTFLAIGDKDQASKYFFKALELYENQRNLLGTGETYSNIASVHYLMGKLDKAIEYQKKAIEVREIAGDKAGLAISNNNISQLYLLKANTKLSLVHIKQAVANAEATDNGKLMSSTYAGMSMYYVYCGKYSDALSWQTKALKISEEIDDKQQLSRLYVAVANLADGTKDSALAISYFDKALEVSKALANKENIGNVYEKMSIFYNKHNDHKKALKLYKIFILYKDSINAKSNLSKIEEIQTRYETEKKDNEIKKLQVEQKIKVLQIEKQNAVINGNTILAKKKETEIALLAKESLLLKQAGELQNLQIAQQDEEIDRQKLVEKNTAQQLKINVNEKIAKDKELVTEKKIRSFLLAGLLLTLLLAVLFVNRYKLKRKLEQQSALLEIRNNISKDLHDEIGSTLTSISILSNVSELALEKQPAQAKEMIHQIAMQSKTIQQNMSDIVWSIRPENESVENLTTRVREYAAQTLEPLNINSSIALDENIIAQKLPMRYRKEILLICKEAINNIAKHSGASKASVSIKKVKETILLTITDNGSWKGTTSGTGTKSMKERATSIGGILNFSSSVLGTSITAIVPIP
jgi:two-component system, NarL family, sensor histidine kinase UhpB